MNFEELSDFIQNRMHISDVYQPVMLMTLLKKGGEATQREIAKAILSCDESQIERYEHMARQMVGKVLQRQKIVQRQGNRYRFVGFEQLSTQNVRDLVNLCEQKLAGHIERRGRHEADSGAVQQSTEHREAGCVFCNMQEDRIVRENRLAYAIRDKFPVTALHTLIVPRRHVLSYFELGRPEINACHQLLAEIRGEVVSSDSDVKGFNIGINQGIVAGQTIVHCHIHLIPRRGEDIDDPRGGVRHVIPGKGCYETGAK